MIRKLWRLWCNHRDATRRQIDIDILWPLLCEVGEDIAIARLAFAQHAFADDAWLNLGDAEIARQINALQFVKSKS